ncbi:hypothetical protein ACTXT7_017507, partial [Hymenolepis weldensis]
KEPLPFNQLARHAALTECARAKCVHALQLARPIITISLRSPRTEDERLTINTICLIVPVLLTRRDPSVLIDPGTLER